METISRQELKAKLDANQDIKLVMTVGGWTFRARHIPGSLSFPSPGCALQTLRRDDEIIVYSTSDGRQDTRAAFDALTAHGWSGYGWPPAEASDGACLGDQPAMAGAQPERQVV